MSALKSTVEQLQVNMKTLLSHVEDITVKLKEMSDTVNQTHALTIANSKNNSVDPKSLIAKVIQIRSKSNSK